jgi:uncharacterized protein YjbI with pentapeptide repeats
MSRNLHLPQDLRNRSFRGRNCEGWDFSGRDIRGCDFSNAKLNGANFSNVIAGRSQSQNTLSIINAYAYAYAYALAGAGADADVVAFAVAGAVAGAGAAWRAIEAFSQGRILEGFSFAGVVMVYFGLAWTGTKNAIREFRNATGTNYQGATLVGVDFSHATLNNCKFKGADTRDINWSHVKGIR